MTAAESGVRPELLELGGRVAVRYRLLCPACGLDVLAGDRLGDRPGFRAIWETLGQGHQGAVLDPHWREVSTKTDALLSKLADSGLARLSLAALGRVLNM